MQLKDIMIELMGEVHNLTVKQAQHEQEKLKVQHNRLPRDIALLSKDEQTLRRELALLLEDTELMKDNVQKELSRLRREHHGNLHDLDQYKTKLNTQQMQL